MRIESEVDLSVIRRLGAWTKIVRKSVQPEKQARRVTYIRLASFHIDDSDDGDNSNCQTSSFIH